jgi:hypothetical protein
VRKHGCARSHRVAEREVEFDAKIETSRANGLPGGALIVVDGFADDAWTVAPVSVVIRARAGRSTADSSLTVAGSSPDSYGHLSGTVDAVVKKRPIMDFHDALAEAEKADGAKPSMLLGNGFSIAASDNFAYGRLLDEADFGGRRQSTRVREVFDSLNSADFEMVVRRLQETAETLKLYPGKLRPTRLLLRADAERVRDGLTEAISEIHPANKGEIGDIEMGRTSDFLEQFGEVFTLNYDLLLYWAMGSNGFRSFDDGFRRSADGDLEHLRPENQTVHFLHGALHLWEEADLGGEPITYKKEWTRGSTLIEALRAALDRGRYPLVVMEGTARQKQTAIDASPYLRGCLRSLRDLGGSLFTHGWAMSDNDDHIVQAIEKSGVKRLYVGLIGQRREGSNPSLVAKAEGLVAKSGDRIGVKFWDARTAGLW